MRNPKIKIVRAWGGFTNSKLDTWCQDGVTQLAIWKDRKQAKQRYDDVRKVSIVFEKE